MKNERNECDCNIIHKEVVKTIKNQLLKNSEFQSLANLFKILGDATRTKIVWMLSEQEMCVCDISNVLNMTKSRVSHQLAVLRKAGILESRKDGRTVYYELNDNHVRELFALAIKHVKHFRK